jgi:hypothetical protein
VHPDVAVAPQLDVAHRRERRVRTVRLFEQKEILP